jgi:hypothetical protein
MKDILHFTYRLIQNLLWSVILIGGAYLFIALCNWTLNPAEWNGFSRFLLGFAIGIDVIATWSAMSTTVKNIKAKG